MDAFRVSMSTNTPCTAGIDAAGVVSAIFTWVCSSASGRRAEFHSHLGALDSRTSEHLHWLTPDIHVGSIVALDILNAGAVDAPRLRLANVESYPAFLVEHARARVRAFANDIATRPARTLTAVPQRLLLSWAQAAMAFKRSAAPLFALSVNGHHA
jgi:hypothetical protein